MGAKSRNKGKHGERELASVLRKYGYCCRRGEQYCGANGDADVVGLLGIHIECKRVERLNFYDSIGQAAHDAKPGEFPAVFSRRNNSSWLVTMPLADWIHLYQSWELEHNGDIPANDGEAAVEMLIDRDCPLDT